MSKKEVWLAAAQQQPFYTTGVTFMTQRPPGVSLLVCVNTLTSVIAESLKATVRLCGRSHCTISSTLRNINEVTVALKEMQTCKTRPLETTNVLFYASILTEQRRVEENTLYGS